jgi:hypothetical protein
MPNLLYSLSRSLIYWLFPCTYDVIICIQVDVAQLLVEHFGNGVNQTIVKDSPIEIGDLVLVVFVKDFDDHYVLFSFFYLL